MNNSFMTRRTQYLQNNENLYPLQRSSLIIGGVTSILFSALLLDPFIGVLIFSLALVVGLSWRVDMLPIIPFVLTYQWIAITAGYFFLSVYGYFPAEYAFFPGSGEFDNLRIALMIAMLGLFGLVAGLRLSMRWFGKKLKKTTMSTSKSLSAKRAFILTIVIYSVFFVYDVAPKEIWFGGAQIINSLLSLRFIPYFILLLTVFRSGRGYSYVVIATIVAILPELLTGFSRFKEILFVVLLAYLAQWRPWIKAPQQKIRNRKIIIVITAGGVLMVLLGLFWAGTLKHEWRNTIWTEEVSGTPIDRMLLFFKVTEKSLDKFNLEAATEDLTSRLSSGMFYFSNVVVRVPDFMPHENGTLFSKAIKNTLTPRFLFPEKENLGGDSWIVRKYSGIKVAGDESDTSVGLGYMGEFYIDFGVPGVLLLCIFYGMLVGVVIVIFARVSPDKDIFQAMVIVILVSSFMSVDGSFIKLFAGLVQRALIIAVVMSIIYKPLLKYLEQSGENYSSLHRVRPHV
ncbi:oligosaccharide repeat unit polymerase [Pseudomonadota bacterium]